MLFLKLIEYHPIFAVLALGASVFVPGWFFPVIMAAVAAITRGPYRGQIITSLDMLSFSIVALTVACLPVFVLMVVP